MRARLLILSIAVPVATLISSIMGEVLAEGADPAIPSAPGTTLEIPVARRYNEALSAGLLGLSGEIIWRRMEWQAAAAMGTTPPAPLPHGPARFQAAAPVLWRSTGKDTLPLILYLYPVFQPSQPHPSEGSASAQGPQVIRLIAASSRPDTSAQMAPFKPGNPGQLAALPRSIPEPPAQAARESCTQAAPRALPGWLCLRQGTDSPMTAHTNLVREGAASPLLPAAGRPLIARDLPQPWNCGDARIAVCAVIDVPLSPVTSEPRAADGDRLPSGPDHHEEDKDARP